MSVRIGIMVCILAGVCVQAENTVHNYVSIRANSDIYYGDTKDICYCDGVVLPVVSPLTYDLTFDTLIYEKITVERGESYQCTRNDEMMNNATGTAVKFQYLDQRDRQFHTLQFFVFLDEQDFVTNLQSGIAPVS